MSWYAFRWNKALMGRLDRHQAVRHRPRSEFGGGGRGLRRQEVGLICMLDANQYEGLSDWDAECIGRLEDGSKVWSGPWKEPGNDSRHFVIVEKEDRLLPFWGTPCAREMANPIDWPEISRRRT